MIFLISKLNLSKQKDYKYNFLVDHLYNYLKDKSKKGDVLIHLGGLFEKNILTPNMINNTVECYRKLSSIIPITFIPHPSDLDEQKISTAIILSQLPNINIIKDFSLIIDNINLTTENKIEENILNVIGCNDTYYIDDNKIYLSSPYQLNNKTEKFGFLVVVNNSMKYKLISNSYSPKYININIDNETDLKILEDINNKDFVNLNISSDIDSDKIRFVLNRYKFNNISFTKKKSKIVEEENILNSLDVDDSIKRKLSNNTILLGIFEDISKKYHENRVN